jgi:hypothetical protein
MKEKVQRNGNSVVIFLFLQYQTFDKIKTRLCFFFVLGVPDVGQSPKKAMLNERHYREKPLESTRVNQLQDSFSTSRSIKAALSLQGTTQEPL